MKVVNRIRYGWHIAEIQQIAGMYKVVIDKELPGTLYSTRKEAEDSVYEEGRKFLGIKAN